MELSFQPLFYRRNKLVVFIYFLYFQYVIFIKSNSHLRDFLAIYLVCTFFPYRTSRVSGRKEFRNNSHHETMSLLQNESLVIEKNCSDSNANNLKTALHASVIILIMTLIVLGNLMVLIVTFRQRSRPACEWQTCSSPISLLWTSPLQYYCFPFPLWRFYFVDGPLERRYVSSMAPLIWLRVQLPSWQWRLSALTGMKLFLWGDEENRLVISISLGTFERDPKEISLRRWLYIQLSVFRDKMIMLGDSIRRVKLLFK